MMSQATKESANCDIQLHGEIAELRHILSLRDQHIEALETACLRETDHLAELQTKLGVWQEKYDRLYDSHKRIQKVNQNLEDKLLRLVDRGAGERAQLTSDVATLSVRLAQANYTITTLQREVERYKNDMSLAIQLIQCKPDNFVPQKLNSLPLDVQSKVAAYMRLDIEGSIPGSPTSQQSIIGDMTTTHNEYKIVPSSRRDSPAQICPFPPTAMVYSMRGYDTDGDSYTNEDINVSASIVAKVLEDGIKETRNHCETCRCATKDLNLLPETNVARYTMCTQTYPLRDIDRDSTCVRCSSYLPFPYQETSNTLDNTELGNRLKLCEGTNRQPKGAFILKPNNDHQDLISFDSINLGHHRLCDKSNKDDYKINSDNSDKSNLVSDPNIKGDVLIDIEDTKNDSKISVADSNTENSKSNIPRLCSLRIQDGSSNIILNKLSENNTGPIMYTRRKLHLENDIRSAGYMDREELNPVNFNMSTNSYTNNRTIISDITRMNNKLSNDNSEHMRLYNNHIHEKDKNGCNGLEITNRDSGINLSDDTCLLNNDMSNNMLINENQTEQVKLYNNHLNENSVKFGFNGIETTNRDSGINLSDDAMPLDNFPKCDVVARKHSNIRNNNNTMMISETKQYTSENNTDHSNSISSSISSAELRESAQLLRQQLHRVAEWVNTNANMVYRDAKSSESDQSHRNRSKISYESHRQSVDSDFAHLHGNYVLDNFDKMNTTNEIYEVDRFNKNTHIVNNDFVKPHNNTLNSTDSFEVVKAKDMSYDNCQILMRNDSNFDNNEKQTMTDLEQMEYNVKQFLLRQNEWSNGQV